MRDNADADMRGFLALRTLFLLENIEENHPATNEASNWSLGPASYRLPQLSRPEQDGVHASLIPPFLAILAHG